MALLLRTSLFIGLIFSCLNASADIAVDDYREFAKDPESGVYRVLQNYVDGLGTGARWANTSINEIYGVPLYCPGTNGAITAEKYMAILKGTVDKYDPDRHELIGKLLIIGLMETYPCK
jgi:hypothetical protein